MAYNTAYDLDGLVVATKAATVYTAQENSLFLGGGLIPMVNLPAGSISAQIPVMGSVTATKLTSASHDATDLMHLVSLILKLLSLLTSMPLVMLCVT